MVKIVRKSDEENQNTMEAVINQNFQKALPEAQASQNLY